MSDIRRVSPDGGLALLIVGALCLLTQAAPLAAKPLVLDTFDDEAPANMLEGGTGAWGDPSDKSVSCAATHDAKTRLGDSGFSLRLDYDVDSARKVVRIPTNVSIQNPATIAEDVYNGYFSALGAADLRPFKYLIFSVKGDPEKGFTRSFKIEMKDPANAAGVTVEGVTDKWQKMVVPLRKFQEIKDWSRVKEWVLVFGPSLVTRKEGTLYFDDIYFAADPGEKIRFPERSLELARLRAPLEVDGVLKDWPEPAFVSLEDFEEFGEAGAVSKKGDLAAWFAGAWDQDHLYLAVDVQDNEVLNPHLPENIWRGDCVELYVDPTGEGLVWGDPAHFQLGLSPTSSSGAPAVYAFFQKRAPREDEVASAIKAYKDGYQIEAAIAWEFLGIEPQPGRPFGVSLAVHDHDAKDPSVDAKVNWSFEPREGGRARLGKAVLK